MWSERPCGEGSPGRHMGDAGGCRSRSQPPCSRCSRPTRCPAVSSPAAPPTGEECRSTGRGWLPPHSQSSFNGMSERTEEAGASMCGGGGELRWGEERCRGSRGGVHWPFRTRMRLARPWHWVGGRQAFAVWVVAGWRVGRMGGGGPASGARRTAGRREAVGGRRVRGDTAGEVYKRYPPNACTPSDDQ